MIDPIPFTDYDRVEVLLSDDQNFLKVIETLTRMGITGKQEKTLYQSCLPAQSRIITEDGVMTIKDIVDSKYIGKVLSINNDGIFEYNSVIAHHVKENIDKTWVKLICTPFLSSKRLTCTSDHLVGVVDDCFDPKIKFIEAKDAIGKFLVRYPINIKSNKMHNVSSIFNKEQIEYLIGTILGDSCITKRGGIQMTHCLAQQDYIEEKQKLFGGNLRHYDNGGYPAIMLNIESNEQTKKMRKLFYPNDIKNVKNIIPFITEKSLAYWYMDDGNIRKTQKKPNTTHSCIFNTQGFTYDEHLLLEKMFNDKFNLFPTINKYKTQYDGKEVEYCRLSFSVSDSDKLFSIISPYMNDTMLYKITHKYHDIDHHIPNNKKLDYALQEIKEVVEWSKENSGAKYLCSKLYDIEVENNHNFIANDSLVHNCHLLHVKGKYYIMHFKEMFKLDGKLDTIEREDIERRNRIAMLLDEWGLVKVIDKSIQTAMCPMQFVKIIPFKEKGSYQLFVKYKMGKRY